MEWEVQSVRLISGVPHVAELVAIVALVRRAVLPRIANVKVGTRAERGVHGGEAGDWRRDSNAVAGA